MASKPTFGNGGMASDTKTPATAGLDQTKPKIFDEQGAIGKQFTETPPTYATPTEQGAIGGAAQSIGGPLAKDGAVGKQFTSEGGVGGTVQKALGGENGSA